MKLSNYIFFVSNDGGHFAQLMSLHQLFDKYDAVIVTDNERANKKIAVLKNVKAIEFATAFAKRRKELSEKEQILTRWSYAIAYLKLFKECFMIWRKYHPCVIISTGSNMAVPFCYISRIVGSKFVYIETRARVYGMSVTGKIVGRLADKVLVQWPEMVKIYKGKAEYYGTLI